MARYHVSARPREQYPGFWRDGRFFPNAPAFVELSEEEMTDAIREEPMLLITVVEEEKKGQTEKKVKQDVSTDAEQSA